MRFGLILVSATLLLAGCSGRHETDRPEDMGPAPEAAADSPLALSGSTGKKANKPAGPAEDIKKAAKRLPDTLAGDSANSAHLGDPIQPQ